MGVLIFGSGGGSSGSGPDLSADTIQDRYVLSPYTFHDHEGNPGTGTIYNWDGTILAGASSDGNKMTVSPSSSTRHIAAGSYLNREIELAPMPSGSTALSQSGNIVTLTKQAGYIEAGSQQLTVSAGSTSLSRTGATVKLTRQAGYVSSGTDSMTVPLYAGTVNVTANGATTVTPTSGYAGFSSLTVNTSVPGSTPSLQNRSVTITSNGTNTYYATSSAYDGLYSLTVTTNVNSAPSTGSGTVSNGGSYLDISCPSGYTLYMAGFMASSASYSNTSRAVGGYARKGSSTGRGSYITSNGDPAVGNLTASFSGNTVTITPLSGYSFSGMSYAAFVVYG